MNFPQLLHEYVIIKRDENPDKPPVPTGTFEVPDELKEKPITGEVVAASKGYYAKETGTFIPLEVKKGDRVRFGSFAGAPITINGEPFWMLKQSDITMII